MLDSGRSAAVSTVHVVFKTHLDVGFTNLASAVIRRYLQEFIPLALDRAAASRAAGGARFIWTTGSYLIHRFLEQSDRRGRRAMEAAIAAGDIAWHALPFTTHTELLDEGLFRHGLSLSATLDRRFGRRTIAAKVTDVPGHTRAIVPLLAEAGVRMLHIGVNPACSPPDVPPVFLWKVQEAEVAVVYSRDYGQTTVVPGLSDALAVAFTGDNLGPQGPVAIEKVFQQCQQAFAAAQVVGGRLDDFSAALWRHRGSLPVLSAEIGDTWIHGAGSDPLKVSKLRALCRLHQRWLEGGSARPGSRRAATFAENLLLVAEHTWGLDEKTHLDDYENYAGRGFRNLRRTARCRKFESSWQEQRDYLAAAVAGLGKTRFAAEARAVMAESLPAAVSRRGFTRIDDPSVPLVAGSFSLQLDRETGAICRLRHNAGGRNWASSKQPLGLFRYQTFSQEDYDRFIRQYARDLERTASWAIKDLTKPGIADAGAVSQCRAAELVAAYRRDDERGTMLMLQLRLPGDAVQRFGAPARIVVLVDCPAAAPEMHFDVRWFDKPACRLPEAAWFSFCPTVRPGGGWTIEKMGHGIDARDVVSRGARSLHATSGNVTYRDARAGLRITTVDAPLVAPGQPSLLDFANRLPTVKGGVHFNLHNNLWGTNFPMWYEDDARFRFSLRFEF